LRNTLVRVKIVERVNAQGAATPARCLLVHDGPWSNPLRAAHDSGGRNAANRRGVKASRLKASATMRAMNGPDAAAETITGYGFRRAYEAAAFDQFPLITPSKLSDEARDRGIQRASSFLKELERLDREGAFRPVLFEVVDAEGAEAVVFRDERDYVPWSEYEVAEWDRAVPRPRYSPWQLLYLNDAVELPKTSVPIEWRLDDERRATLDPGLRSFVNWQLERWRQLDREWRDVLLVLIHLQGWYGPSVKGTLLKGTVTLVRHPESGEYVDPATSSRPSTRTRCSPSWGSPWRR
jgi:hypothetical protein